MPDDEEDNSRPYAYLSYIIYDENMVYQDAGWVRVPETAASDQSELYLQDNEPVRMAFDEPVLIEKSGYIYVWVSNKSKETNVWFDDLRVTNTQNIVVQSTDYGVWGDVMREQKTEEKRYRFGYQGQFAERDEETGYNAFEARMYDPVVGRWISTDPSGQYWSPYVGMGNDPVNSVDPDGRFSKFGAWWRSKFIPNSEVVPYDGEYGIYWQTQSQDGSGAFSMGHVITEGGPGLRKGLGTDILNSIQEVFDYGGAIPVAGEAIDGINAGIYLLKGDLLNAGISGAAMVPVLGSAKVGRKIWTATKGKVSKTVVENAFGHWKKHGVEFPEFKNAKQYVEGASNFMHSSPHGTLTKVRPNGDVLKYHPASNTFGVMDATGAPRTLFRPNDGINYWQKQ